MPPEIVWTGLESVRDEIDRVADTHAPVLILGETGTGKEVIARYLHSQSRRRHQRYVPTTVSAPTKELFRFEFFGSRRGAFTGATADHQGHFVQAHQGTIFLDEVGELELPVQHLLLRVLEEGEIEPLGWPIRTVDTRVVAATNVDLAAAVKEGRFRKDLYYRLTRFATTLPPLRQRGAAAIRDLAIALLRSACEEFSKSRDGFAPGVMERIVNAEWRGNARELRNAIDRAVVLGNGPLVDIVVPQVSAFMATNPPGERMEVLREIGQRTGTFRMRDQSFQRAALTIAERLVEHIEAAGDTRSVVEIRRSAIGLTVHKSRPALLLDELAYGFAIFIRWDAAQIGSESISRAFLSRHYTSNFNKGHGAGPSTVGRSDLGVLYGKILDLVVDTSTEPAIDYRSPAGQPAVGNSNRRLGV
jgi:DNA-binding NtrC family response regulator